MAMVIRLEEANLGIETDINMEQTIFFYFTCKSVGNIFKLIYTTY